MERNRIEGLFKDKLEGYVLDPSNETRERFQAMIQDKNRKVLFRRIGIAASIFLITFTGIYSFNTLFTEKIDLSKGESQDSEFSSGFYSEMTIQKEAPAPASIMSGKKDEYLMEDEITPDTENSIPANFLLRPEEGKELQNGKNVDSDIGTINSGIADINQEYEQISEDHVEESAYIEYFVAEPGIMEDEQSDDFSNTNQAPDPMKITIEYISSANKDRQSESKRSNFYSKLDNMKTMDEVLGDLRSYKDRLFALDFKKEEKAKNEEEKSKE